MPCTTKCSMDFCLYPLWATILDHRGPALEEMLETRNKNK